MGTTLVVLMLHEESSGAILHVGDSRAYRLRDGGFEQLTTDHSIVNDLLKNQEISEDEARNHPYRHVLTRALGAAEDVAADVTPIEVRDEDVYLLCSDGVYGMLSDQGMQAILSRHRTDPERAASELIDAANAAGGKDNASAIVLYCAPGH
jgi:protein phosphatase